MEEYKSFVVRRRKHLEREKEKKRKLKQKKENEDDPQPDINPEYEPSKLTSRSSMEDLFEHSMTPNTLSVPLEGSSPRLRKTSVSTLDSSRKISVAELADSNKKRNVDSAR